MLNTGLTEIVTAERVETGFVTHRFGRIILTTMPSQLTANGVMEVARSTSRRSPTTHPGDRT